MSNKTIENPNYLDPATLQQIEPLELLAREVVEGMRVGMHRSSLSGLSTEFSHHRPYVPGDEVDDIDWRVYARTERYYVKLYEAETNYDAHLLIDASTSMRYGSDEVTKLEYAKYMAASLAYMITDQGDTAGLALYDDELRSYIEPRGSKSVIGDMASELDALKPRPRTNVSGLLHEFAERINRRGFVILFSDLFDDLDAFVEGIQHLRYSGHNVVVFHILDHAELEFPFEGSKRFEGLEGEDDLVTQPRRVRKTYLEALDRFLTRARESCENANVDYALVDTSKPVGLTLSSYLMSRMNRER